MNLEGASVAHDLESPGVQVPGTFVAWQILVQRALWVQRTRLSTGSPVWQIRMPKQKEVIMQSEKKLREALEIQSKQFGARKIGVVQTDSLKNVGGLYGEVMKILPEARSVISFISPFPKGAIHLLKDPTRGMPFYTRLAGIAIQSD